MTGREMPVATPFERRLLYVALEDLDFVWDEAEVPQVVEMWRDGQSLHDIAKTLDRDPDEVTLLVMDLARQGRISRRKRGARGA
ncbi:helix-turn-helix domain-containing protein [Mechercharimyces sp. CAU 1602]|uniref:helix-turn-helix domain-containing protein n=1 Tax=Mechercharimyces sp. CAU 1602 TaxID=2973933 RepID=UPI0021638172|nr:helix-turn-helix domain-containing protein [Mechercharimyces sp. CAU 1602]MCS1351176.1 helix-turn-helix domain-containing protein [Mechercharimyces sp. CAU 1602]